MSDKDVTYFQNLMLARAEQREAYQQYNYASTRLEPCKVYERMAEMASQHEPLNRFPRELREQILDVLRYVVHGRKLSEVRDE